jgi:hypothetical protein
MVPIPPPPLPSGQPKWAPPSGIPAGSAPAQVEGLSAGQIDKPWRWILQLGWVLIVITMFSVGGGSDRLGKPTWWMDPLALSFIPFVLPVLAGLFALMNSPRALIMGWAGTLSLAATALLDVSPSPGAALIEGGLALSGLLITTSALAGRVPGSVTASG